MRRTIYEFLLSNGPATDEQIRDALGLGYSTQTATRRGLVKDRWVRATEGRALTSSGNPAIKWKARKAK